MDETAATFQGHGSKSYRAYVLGALLVIYTFNFIDRILIGIVQEPIKAEFGLSNLQLGILGGPAFALLYTLAGIPIARMAERTNRITIVAIGAAVWSIFTALCGFAQSFVQLLAARIGVGIGEAACVPPSHSVISDYFPSDRRASALAIYALGIPIGTGLAAVGGGWLTQNVDWRTAFWLLGAPGVVAAIALKLTVREPPRAGATGEKTPGFGEALKAIAGKAAFWHVAFAGALVGMFGYGSAQFFVSHMVRNYDLAPTLPDEIALASYAFGAIAGLAVGVGTFLGGFLSDRLARRHKRVLTWLPALGFFVSIPIYLLSFYQRDFALAFPLLLIAPIALYLYLGPMFAIAQGVAPVRMRATATALMLFVVNLIGYGLGPPLVGLLNDVFAGQILAASGLSHAACANAVAGERALCASADALGLKYALASMLVFVAWAGLHFLLAGRTLLKDRES